MNFLFTRKSAVELNQKNSCYYSNQTGLFSRRSSKNFKINVNKTIVFSVVLYICETWSLILMEESRLTVCEETILR